ncbi:MAG: hypothetical protein QY323_03675 [Patescibacteria group bacterium]|nr:MAG: hypothetical protein QY323_03675 [Patescibacteria group bacterium]
MIVQSLRFALAEDLDLMWEPDRNPSLRFILEDPEYRRFVDAGGNGAWDHITLHLSVIADYLFGHQQPAPRRNLVVRISRAEHQCLRIAFKIDDHVFMERTYSEHLFHAAFRMSGHVPAVNALFERLFDSNEVSYRDALRAMVHGTAADEPPDPEEAKWRNVWIDEVEERAEPKPAVVTPPEPAILVPVHAKTIRVPAGPFKLQQLRMYAGVLASGKNLPDNLSEDGRNQVLAYYTQHHQVGSA